MARTKTRTTVDLSSNGQVKRPRLNFGDKWDDSPAPESTAIVKIDQQYGHFIGGKFVEPAEG